MKPEGRLNGKVAIVTGASRGIGKAIALNLAKEEATVVATATTLEGVQRTSEEIQNMGNRSLPLKVDVAKAADVENMVRTVIEKFGRIDILVNNAGVLSAAPLTETTEKDWDANFNVNVKGVFLCCKAVAKQMIKQKEGKIVNIGSCASKRGWPYLHAYSASKFALVGLTQSVAFELAPHNIQVNAVCPGNLHTRMHDEFVPKMMKLLNTPTTDAYYEALFRQIPLGRLQTAEDIARAVVFLASKDADNITAQAINVDGGQNVY